MNNNNPTISSASPLSKLTAAPSRFFKKGTGSLLLDIAIIFIIISAASLGLRLLHDLINDKKISLRDLNPLAIHAVQAAADQAQLINQSHTEVNIRPNTGFTFNLTFQNNSAGSWTRDNVYLKSLTTALKFHHDFWPDPFHPSQLQEAEVAPGEYGTFKFALQSPPNFGEFTGDFVLVNNNVIITGGKASVYMNVVADPEAIVKKPADPATPDNYLCTLNFRVANLIDGTDGVDNTACVSEFSLPPQGPTMRIGLFHSAERITIKNTKPWQIQDQNGLALYTAPADMEIGFFYSPETQQYSFDTDKNTIRTESYLQLKNVNAGMYTITSYHNVPTYNTNIDYNDFIGDLEIRYNDSKERTWVIEILPMETYLEGIQETTNYDPIEYLKTMSVAARTYAAYHYDRYTKHADEFFHVDSVYDQVYKGYVSMQIFPRVGEAVRATRGIIGTYNDKVIVAPYFSRSDGRTRSFKEVWNVEVPYLQSVPTPYTEGKTLFGHGVGIDATDALNRAYNDDWTYDQLLKYYYQDIQLEQIY